MAKISYSFKAIAAQVASILQAAGINVSKWNGTAVAAPDTAGYPKVTVKSGTGTGEISLAAGLVKGVISVQYGTITMLAGAATGTYVCSPTVGAKALALHLGSASSHAADAKEEVCYLTFSGGTVTAHRVLTADDVTVAVAVVDFG